MKADMILLRFGELTLKGRNRKRFEQAMQKQIKAAIKAYPNATIMRTHDRIYIELNNEPFAEIAARLEKVFGLSSFSPVWRVPLDVEEMREAGLRLMQSLAPEPTTFKVSVRRANKQFPHNSQELQPMIASYILRQMNHLKVDVHQPEIDLRFEVREEAAYVFSQVVKGLGGFPFGTNGKAMLMLSGGIDSPVAGWLAMRRGIQIEAVHFHSFPFTSERAKQKVIDLAAKLAEYAGEIKLHLVPFTDIQTRLRQSGHDQLLITFMRRAMMRITERLAEQSRALAVVTGENLGQVASQTLPSLNVIGRATELPILQPLIAMDKEEIIRLAERIDTYETSILPYEDCCTLFVPKHPSTNPNLHIVNRMEQQFTWLDASIEEAVEQTEVMILRRDQPNHHTDEQLMDELL